MRKPKSVTVGIDLHFLQINGTWEPNDEERQAAWELYIELITRVGVVELAPDEGLLSEALSSLYTLFATTREILRRHGPIVAEPKPSGQYSFGYLSVAMLNLVLRPVLSLWHPMMEEWDNKRPIDTSQTEHERSWPRAPELRSALAETRKSLTAYAGMLATACGVPDLSAAIPR